METSVTKRNNETLVFLTNDLKQVQKFFKKQDPILYRADNTLASLQQSCLKISRLYLKDWNIFQACYT